MCVCMCVLYFSIAWPKCGHMAAILKIICRSICRALWLILREREKKFYFTSAKPGCRYMAAISEGGMSLHLRGKSRMQTRRPFYLFVVQLFIQRRVYIQIINIAFKVFLDIMSIIK